jgi:hypothetical protein
VSTKPNESEGLPAALPPVNSSESGPSGDASTLAQDFARPSADLQATPTELAATSDPLVRSIGVIDQKSASLQPGPLDTSGPEVAAPAPPGVSLVPTRHGLPVAQLGHSAPEMAPIQDAVPGGPVHQYSSWEDTTLTFLATSLTVIIIAILFRRLMRVTGTDVWTML